jgi:hypothetical protein
MHAVVLIVVCQNVSINHGLYEEKANPRPSYCHIWVSVVFSSILRQLDRESAPYHIYY